MEKVSGGVGEKEERCWCCAGAACTASRVATVLEMLSTHLPLEAELEEWTKTIAGLAGADACMSQLREALLRGKGEENNGGGGLDQALLACNTCWNAIHAENWKNVRGSCQNRLRRTLPTALDVKKVR
jgi:hypothetical protein